MPAALDTANELGGALQVLGALIEATALGLTVVKAKKATKEYREEEFDARNDADLAALATSFVDGQVPAALKYIAYVRDRVDRLERFVADLTKAPLRLLLGGILCSAAGAAVSAWG